MFTLEPVGNRILHSFAPRPTSQSVPQRTTFLQNTALLFPVGSVLAIALKNLPVLGKATNNIVPLMPSSRALAEYMHGLALLK